MRKYLALFILVVILASCGSERKKQLDVTSESAKPTKVDKTVSSQLSNQFNNVLQNFVDMHDHLPIERLYVANFQQINDSIQIFLSTDINIPEVIEGTEKVKGVIEKDSFKLIIIDDVASDGYGLYNPQSLKEVDIDFNDDP